MSSKSALSGILYEDSVTVICCEPKACMCSISVSSSSLSCVSSVGGSLRVGEKERGVSGVSVASTKSWSIASSRVEDGLGVGVGVLAGTGAIVGATVGVGDTVNTGVGGTTCAEVGVAGAAVAIDINVGVA